MLLCTFNYGEICFLLAFQLYNERNFAISNVTEELHYEIKIENIIYIESVQKNNQKLNEIK